MDSFREYVTRCIKMWLLNTESAYNHYTATAREDLAKTGGDKEKAVKILAEQIQETLDYCKPTKAGMYDDILTNALLLADYYEIAECFFDD